MKNEQEILDQISRDVEWYKLNGMRADIEKLLAVRDNLACFSYNLAEIVGDAYIDFNGKYFLRKLHVASRINSLVKKELAVNKAEHQSLEDNQEIFNAEKESEGLALKYDKLLRQADKVLEAMNQRISHLKKEKEKTDYEQI